VVLRIAVRSPETLALNVLSLKPGDP